MAIQETLALRALRESTARNWRRGCTKGCARSCQQSVVARTPSMNLDTPCSPGTARGSFRNCSIGQWSLSYVRGGFRVWRGDNLVGRDLSMFQKRRIYK